MASKAHGWPAAGALALGKKTLSTIFFTGFKTDKLSPEWISITDPIYDFSLIAWDLVTYCYFHNPFFPSTASCEIFLSSINYLLDVVFMASFPNLAKPFFNKIFLTSSSEELVK